MSVSEPQRLQLYESARDALGDEPASTLMTMLGHEGDPLATQSFVAQAIEPLATKDYVDRAIQPLATKDYVDRAVEPLATRDYVRDQTRRMAIAVSTVGSAWGALIVAILSLD